MKLDPAFFQQTTLQLAPALLGKILVRNYQGRHLAGRIVEVEAYRQHGDLASHSRMGPTQRNAMMFGPPGFWYVYFIYGVHYCVNLVTEPEGLGDAVLIRALEPLQEIPLMSQLRKGKPLNALTSGPAKTCQALAIDQQHNGLHSLGPVLWLEDGTPVKPKEISSGPRIGIRKSTDLPWRFFIQNNPFVSASPKNQPNR